MSDNLKYRLTKGWGFMRVARLLLALVIILQALSGSEFIFAALGAFLLFQAVFNYGCCGTAGCDISHENSNDKSSDKTEELTTFTEVK